MKYIKLFENFINEQVDTSMPTEGKEVVIMPGRFQPFHNGHIAALKRAADVFGCPVIPMQILSKKDKSPFPESLLREIGKTVTQNESEIHDFVIYPNSYGKTVIPWFVRYLREHDYEAIGVAGGSDREKSYAGQIKYITGPKTDTVVQSDFRFETVDQRVEGGPSGTKVREALANNDQDLFNQMVPTYLHKYYDKLRKYV